MIEISVVVPCRITNREELATLQEALHRILHQSIDRSRYEVVLVDDGSDINLCDELKVLPEYADMVSIIRHQKKGPAAARNNGIMRSKGETILFLGSDVLIQHNLLEAHLEVHGNNNGVVVINQVRAGEKTVLGKEYLEVNVGGFHEGVKYDMPSGAAFCTSCVSVRRQYIETEMFDDNFAFAAYEDTDVGYRLHRNGIKVMVAKRTSATHDHIHSVRSLRERSRRCGMAYAYLVKKHPKLRLGINCIPGSCSFYAKSVLYGVSFPIAYILSRLPFRYMAKCGMEAMCKYEFLRGVAKAKA